MQQPSEESIGQRVRRLRLERGLSQRELSAQGVSYAYISRIEAGERMPSVKALRTLARKLGVSPEYLETGRDLAAREELEIALNEAELELRLAADTAGAEERLRGLLLEADEAGDAAVAVRARAALGFVAFRRGEHREAIRQLEAALTSGRVSPVSHWELYGTLGRAYVSTGQAQRALELFEGCVTELERAAPDNDVAHVRLATFLSYALSEVGDLARAREVVRSALDRAESVADPYTRVRLYWSQARLAMFERDPRTALENLRRAIALLEATEDTRQLGRAHLLWAEILTFERQTEQAAPHLKAAEELLGAHPDAEDLYWLRTEQARHLAQRGSADEAIMRAGQALELIGDSDPAERGAAYWALGEAMAAAGDLTGANESLRLAVELLRGQRIWHEAAAACRTWATVLGEAGRESEAATLFEQAAELDGRSAVGTRA
jgi:transcriptional regulator with XRE-family HTH domain